MRVRDHAKNSAPNMQSASCERDTVPPSTGIFMFSRARANLPYGARDPVPGPHRRPASSCRTRCFLDCRCPRMSGVDVVREIGAPDQQATIFVTAYDE